MMSLPTGADILRCEPQAIGTPSGRAEYHARRLARRARGEHFADDGHPFVEGDSNRIECLDILDYAVARGLFIPFRGEGTEPAIPYHQHPGIVAIEITRVGRMMHQV